MLFVVNLRDSNATKAQACIHFFDRTMVKVPHDNVSLVCHEKLDVTKEYDARNTTCRYNKNTVHFRSVVYHCAFALQSQC